MKPVAITGIGAVSRFGYGLDRLVHGVATGIEPFVPIPEAEYKHCPGLFGPLPPDALPKGDSLIARANGFCRTGYWAAHAALRDAGYKPGNGYRCALVSGTALGYSVVDQFGDMLDLTRAQYLYHSSVNGLIAIKEQIRGLQIMLHSLESGSTQGIGLAAQLIAGGSCDAALAGGVEVYSRALHACYAAVGRVAPLDSLGAPASAIAMRPWDPERHGFVFSEGACYLMLEDLDKAVARGATIHALIAGWGSCQEAAHDGYVIDEGGGSLTVALEQALSRASVGYDEVAAVIGSGNGARQKDAVELRVLAEAFASAPAAVELTGFKETLGETLGASGAFSVALACLTTARGGTLPATRGGAEIAGALRFSNGCSPAGRHLLLADLGYRGDASALLLRRR